MMMIDYRACLLAEWTRKTIIQPQKHENKCLNNVHVVFPVTITVAVHVQLWN